MIPLPIPAPYLYAGLFLAGVVSGGYAVHTWYKAQRVDAIEQARKDEHGLQRGANQAGVRYADALLEQQQTADKNERNFRRILNATNRQLNDCRVGADLVGLLDEAGMSAPAGDPREPGPGAAPVAPAPDSSCAVELEKCAGNYRDACVPNAIQLRELQGFTRNLILDYNRRIGRE